MPSLHSKPYSDIVEILAKIYFLAVNLIFSLYYATRPRLLVSPPKDRLLLLSATKAASAIRDRQITSTELVNAYIARLSEVNGLLNAVADSDYDSVRQQAAKVDEIISSADDIQLDELSHTRPLLGVPFTAKDATSVAGLAVTVGIEKWRGRVAEKNALIIDRMMAAGAIPLAVSNVPEMVLALECINTIYGRTVNPYDSRRTCGGSSGGEGALLGAAASVIGIGTDIGGSIRYPAYACGVFGLATTTDVALLAGMEPSKSPGCYRNDKMVRIGPMCRYAEDLAVFYDVLHGIPHSKHRELPIDDLRIFYIEDYDFVSEKATAEMRDSIEKTVSFLEGKYRTTATAIRLPLARFTAGMYGASVKAPGSTNTWQCVANEEELASSSAWRELLVGLWRGGNSKRHSAPTMMTSILFDYLAESHDEEWKKEMITKREALRRQLSNLLGSNGVIVCPPHPDEPYFHNQSVFKLANLWYTALYNVLATPAITCPIGSLGAKGMPRGVQLVGSEGSDRLLMQLAVDLEEGFGGWVPPGSK